jgi:hypothetical protein
MTTILKAMVLPAALTAGLGLAQPVRRDRSEMTVWITC